MLLAFFDFFVLPVDALQYIDLFCLYCVFVIMNVTLAESLLKVILFVYRTLLALSLALSFQLACVRLEENMTLFTVQHFFNSFEVSPAGR